ncbi:hypothetical protein QAD02_007949 [Eretmocerus hayati]|uniref:Uncharacterized protein n=1 Tax=Eretmocerus hayati TaxID=131215 RepID=A0ACC2N534_9HYME|nr:hypothetical protein QAD02_007949 [Eretmocerus hayati]
MECWTFSLIWNPPMTPPSFPSAQVHEIRDPGTETDAGARASNSEDDARAYEVYTNTQWDRLNAFRYPQRSVPTTPATEYTNAHVNQPQQYAGETHHGRPRDERREQVRTTLPMGGETPTGCHSSQPAPHATGNANTQARPSRNPCHEWYSGSSSSDEWTPHTLTPRQQRSRSRSSRSRKQDKESSRTLQVMKTLTSWKISFDGDPRASREKAEEFLVSIKECMETLELFDAEVLTAMPSVLTGRARAWYRTHRWSMTCWHDFKQLFRDQYVGH